LLSKLGVTQGVSRSFSLLNSADKRKIHLVAALQTILGFLDLAAVALFGVLGALTVSGLEARSPGNRVNQFVEILRLDNLTLQSQVTVLAISAVMILTLKTIVSIYITRKTLRFLGQRSANLSRYLISRLLASPLTSIQARSSQETIYDVTVGVSTLTVGVLGACILLLSDLSLLIVLLVALLVVDPLLAFMALVLFGGLALSVYVVIGRQAKFLGEQNRKLLLSCNNKLVEVLNTLREVTVRSRKAHYVEFVTQNRNQSSSSEADMTFIPYIGKYILESAVLLGACVISSIQFYRHDAYYAATSLVIFVSAGMRIAPAMLRIQQSAIQIRMDSAKAESTFKLIQSLDSVPQVVENALPLRKAGHAFGAIVELSDVSYRYPDSDAPAVRNVNLSLGAGKTLAIVGPSGSGKSTLADLILGVLEPEIGKVTISGIPPQSAIKNWPGSIGYVPQDVYIVSGSILQNVALGFSGDDVDEDAVWKALGLAKLDEFVKTLPDGIHMQVGERGVGLSGGQRQRLGIARALYTDPQLLVLDEATSALDGQTEMALSNSINELKGGVTVILIAHRLSTVRDADQVLYLNNGFEAACGTFEQVRAAVPDFDIQAKLLGL
jgi:ATP-binding cassette, subfamily B, bacterial PglK